jgi:hypothetical protein
MAIQGMGKREELAFEQKSDPFISKIISDITNGQEYQPEYTFSEQLLWYQDDKSPSPRFVIPQSMIAIILDSYPNSILAGHLGVKKTLIKIAQRYRWPTLRSDVENYVLSCPTCLRTKARHTKPPGVRKNRIIPERPFDKIQFDLTGPLKAAKVSRAQYILVVYDDLTKFAVARPARTCTTKVILNFLLNEIFFAFGVFLVVNSDNASYFTSKMFEEILIRLGSCPVFSTPYSHTASGVERLTNTLKQMLRAFVNDNNDNWTELLQVVVFSYNTSVHSTTGFCKAELLFGFIPRLPIESALDLPIHRPSAHYLTRLDKVREVARAETIFAQEQNRKKYNAIHKEILFPLKSRVMVNFRIWAQ